MKATAAVPPLALVGIDALGASGLSARALAAAVWASLARFELQQDDALGLGEALRVSPCPLFDAATPPRERMGEMWQRTQAALMAPWLAHAATWPRPVVYLVGPDARARPGLPADWSARMSAPPARTWHGGASLWAQALIDARLAMDASQTHAFVVIAGVDTLMGYDTLRALYAAGGLSTERDAPGLIPGEAAAGIVVCSPRTAHTLDVPQLGQVLGVACLSHAEIGTAAALAQAMRQALAQHGEDAAGVHTLLWDISDPDSQLNPMAEAIAELSSELQGAQLTRPFMHLGQLGAAFGPVAAVLAIEGARAGVTPGDRSLIVSLDTTHAAAVYLATPWRPHIMLQDRRL